MTDKEKNSKDMYTSVSAITDADDCLRRWWLHKRCKLPQDQRKATIFGDVHHAVCARFLEADDRGVDIKTGKPVELYPEGWRVMANRFDKNGTLYKVSDSEAALIKVLVQKAITDGILVRELGRTVEREFETVIFSKGYVKVILKGFVDVDTSRGIEDHKTTKNKKYLLSKAKLRKSIQMMGYAYEKYLQKHQGNIWLCHNGFVKDFDSPLVKKTEVEVSQIEVMEFFNDKILPIIKKMLKYYTEYPPSRVNDWRKVPPANNANQSCNFYYGAPCPYVLICSGMITIDKYLRKYGKTVEDVTGKIDHIEKGKPMNSLMDRIKQEQAGQTVSQGAAASVATQAQEAVAIEVPEQPAQIATGGLSAMLAKVQAGVKSVVGAVAGSIAPVITTAEVVEPIADAVTVGSEKQTAPWYWFNANETECPACKDNDVLGFNSSMEPCMICVCKARAQGKSCPENYVVDVLQDGKLSFTPNDGGETTTTQVVSEPEVKTVMQTIAEKPVATIADTVKQVATVQENKVPASLKTLSQAKIGTELPSAPLLVEGFNMLVGCSYAKTYPGDAEVIYIDILLGVMLQEIAEAAGKETWAVIEHFALMQAIDAYIASLVPVLAGKIVVSTVPSKGSAQARLVDGLRLNARTVIYPFGG